MVIFLISCRTRCSSNSLSCLLLVLMKFCRLTFFWTASFWRSRVIWSSSRCSSILVNSFAIFSYSLECGVWLIKRICKRSSSRSSWEACSSLIWLIACRILFCSLAWKNLLGLIILLNAVRQTYFNCRSEIARPWQVTRSWSWPVIQSHFTTWPCSSE